MAENATAEATRPRLSRYWARLRHPLAWRRAKGGERAARAPFWQRWRRDDVTVAALGITLGLICAMFPWYIFLHPDKFGPPAVTFEGGEKGGRVRAGIEGAGPLGTTMAKEDPLQSFDASGLDLFATGTTPEPGAEAPPPEPEQPFPAEPVVFHIVHIANGRAMIEDSSGLYIVATGDRLPDNSRVARIEERGGRWVVVTSEDAVLGVEGK